MEKGGFNDGQRVLDFEFYRQEAIEAENEKQESARKLETLYRNLPRYAEPATDSERLMNLQYEFRHGNKQVLNAMYELITTVALKMIKTEGARNRHIRRMPDSEKREKAHNVAAYVLTLMTRRKEWYVQSSWGGYLHLRVYKELYTVKKNNPLDNAEDWEEISQYWEGESDDNSNSYDVRRFDNCEPCDAVVDIPMKRFFITNGTSYRLGFQTLAGIASFLEAEVDEVKNALRSGEAVRGYTVDECIKGVDYDLLEDVDNG